jgi:hypothetical protein
VSPEEPLNQALSVRTVHDDDPRVVFLRSSDDGLDEIERRARQGQKSDPVTAGLGGSRLDCALLAARL